MSINGLLFARFSCVVGLFLFLRVDAALEYVYALFSKNRSPLELVKTSNLSLASLCSDFQREAGPPVG